MRKIAKDLKFLIAEKEREEITLKQMKKIKKLYEQAAKDFANNYKMLKGRDNISSVLRRQYIDEMQKDLSGEITKISKQVEKGIEGAILQTSESVVRDNQRMLSNMGFNIKKAFSYVPTDVVETITSGQLYQSDWTLSKAIWGDKKKTISDIHEVIAKGLIENKGSYDIAKDLEKYVDPTVVKDWDWSKVYPNTKRKVEYNAQRLARTLTSHAYQESFVRSTKENPFINAYKWETSNSHTTCDLCYTRESQDLYGLGAGIYPKDALPIDHPNGKCIVVLNMEGSMSDVSDQIAKWYNSPEGTFPEIDKFASSFDKVDKVKKSVVKPKNSVHNIVNGKDISKTWERNTSFGLEIDDVLNAQKFNGLPNVVSESEFNEAVKQSRFIAQRTYSAPSREILEEYQKQLYKGEWYVDCSTGGAQYGQGMYCAADYSGKLTDGIIEEMKHYQELSMDRNLQQASNIFESNISFSKFSKNAKYKYSEEEFEALKLYRSTGESSMLSDLQQKLVMDAFDNGKSSEFNKIFGSMSDDFVKQYEKETGFHFTETLTLSPNAKIVNYDDIYKMQINETVENKIFGELISKLNLSNEDLAFVTDTYKREILGSGIFNYDKINKINSVREKLEKTLSSDEWYKLYDSVMERIGWADEKVVRKKIKEIQKQKQKLKDMDLGSYAALKGYDAINAVGHGASESYTIILNRTKIIFKSEVH